ncbi:cerebral dopamine neurotrophic factor [Cheilinus undulatus]|uniref:cerebral dopamine neurotrophic factor n=1 Tax=Cheilinus undulatus TaxID=241271 RepID=UPI001BD62D8E|nr:cerebral dopamine neurotrophic factor [Cheilinus undulatus]
MSGFLLLVGLLSVSGLFPVSAENCEVCVGFLHRLYSSLTSSHRDLTPQLVEDQLIWTCSQSLGKDARLCYYLGASSDAASRVMASVSRPLSSHVPVEKICQRLNSRDSQICQLTYDRVVSDVSSDALMKLRVSELKKILSTWGEECFGCLEKHEFVSLIQEKAAAHTDHADL